MNEPSYSSTNLYRSADGKGAMVNQPVAAPGTAERNKGTLAPKPSDASPEIQTLPTVREHLDALFDGEDLSEEFMDKAETIFEAAIGERVETLRESIEEELKEQYASEFEGFKEELVERIDDYLNYVVEDWVKQNELAIENGLRTEVAESFINGLKNLFVTNYIDIPEEKLDVLEELVNENEETTDRLNDLISENIELSKLVESYRKAEIFSYQTEDLTDYQIDKFASLAESIEYTGDDEYQRKLQTIKENYFPVKRNYERLEMSSDEDLVDEETTTKMLNENSHIDMYVKALDRHGDQRKLYESRKG